MKSFLWILSVCLLAMVNRWTEAAPPDVDALLQQVGISKGVCSVPDCGTGDLAIDIAQWTSFFVHAFDSDRRAIERAFDRTCQAGMGPQRMRFEWLAPARLPYADNFVDLVVIGQADRGYRADEIARVVRPRGCVLIQRGDGLATSLAGIGFEVADIADNWHLARKGVSKSVDDWTHWYHQSDNNPVSNDAVIRAPYLTRWLGAPYYHAMPVVSTAAGGRIFIASGRRTANCSGASAWHRSSDGSRCFSSRTRHPGRSQFLSRCEFEYNRRRYARASRVRSVAKEADYGQELLARSLDGRAGVLAVPSMDR